MHHKSCYLLWMNKTFHFQLELNILWHKCKLAILLHITGGKISNFIWLIIYLVRWEPLWNDIECFEIVVAIDTWTHCMQYGFSINHFQVKEDTLQMGSVNRKYYNYLRCVSKVIYFFADFIYNISSCTHWLQNVG